MVVACERVDCIFEDLVVPFVNTSRVDLEAIKDKNPLLLEIVSSRFQVILREFSFSTFGKVCTELTHLRSV